MKLTKGWIIGTSVGVIAIAGIVFAMRPEPLIVDTAVIARRPLETTVDADGRTRVRQRYMVVAPVAGRVERIARVEGSLVRAGEVVARLTPLPLDAQGMEQVHARVDGANALVLEASGQVRMANAALEQRRRELSRANRLAEVGGVAPRVVEECQLAALQAEEAVRGALERERAAEADVRQARAALIGRDGAVSAPAVLVRAPASGRVLRVAERSERIVAVGTPLLELGDPSSLEIVIDVLSSDGALIQPGNRVRLAEWGDAGGERDPAQWGRVREVEPAGFTKVSALGVDEQRVNVIVDPDEVPAAVGDGFRVEASVVVWSAQNVVVVPRSALLQTPGVDTPAGWTTFVVKSGRVERRSVRIGHIGGTAAEVLVGIEAGDEVVLFPSDRIVPGARVNRRKS